jgi:hypothetical protein
MTNMCSHLTDGDTGALEGDLAQESLESLGFSPLYLASVYKLRVEHRPTVHILCSNTYTHMDFCGVGATQGLAVAVQGTRVTAGERKGSHERHRGMTQEDGELG